MKSEPLNLFQITEVQLTYRNKVEPKNRLNIDSSASAYNLLKQYWDQNRIELLEEFKVILLNRGNACLGIANIATGGSSAIYVDPKIIFATALKANASAIILAHNHPSGNLKPSKEDVAITGGLVQGGKLLNVEILDHLILIPNGYYSLADNGLMPTGYAKMPMLNTS